MAKKIEFPNGGSAQMESDGTITGTCQLVGGRTAPGSSYTATAIMPDGSRLDMGCYEKYEGKPDYDYYLAPCDGTYKFTATKKGKGYFVLVHSQNAAGPAPGTIISTPPEGYTYQHAYCEYWNPDFVNTVTFKKVSADRDFTSMCAEYKLGGATYDIYDAETEKKVGSITTGDDGGATCRLVTGRKYYAVETKAPQGFVINKKRVTFTAGSNIVSLADEPIRVEVSIRKTDSATNDAAQPGATLAGAVFKLVDARGVSQEATTDTDGCATFKEIPLGDFSIVETRAPEGYKLDSLVHEYHAGADSPHTNGLVTFVVEHDFPNDVIAFDLELAKFKEDPNAEGSGVRWPAEGVQFEIVSLSANEVVTTLTTDAYGFAATPDGAWYGAGTRPEGVDGSLPYDGKGYAVREVASTVPEGYERMDDFTIGVGEQVDGVRLKYIIENATPAARLCIVKTDASSGQTVPLAGFSFRLLDDDGHPVTQENWYPNHTTLDTFTTDDTGSVTLPEQLVPGTYKIEEVAAQPPYLLAGKSVSVDLSSGGGSVAVVRFSDAQATGRALIEKRDASTGDALSGAEFAVVALETIESPDGTIQAVEGETVSRVTTKKNGVGTAEGLPLGSGTARYAFVETKAPDGFVLDSTPHEFVLEYTDGATAVVETQMRADNAPVEVTVRKVDRGTDKPLGDVAFALVRLTPPGESINGNANEAEVDDIETEEIEVKKTDVQGVAMWTHLSPGRYALCEREALPGYLLDETSYPFTVTSEGLIEGEGFEDGVLQLSNDFTKIDISKREIADEEELPGAHLCLTTEHGEVVEQWVSTDEPHRIERLTPGVYILKEERTPATHDVAESVTFSVEETGDVQSVVMYDDPIEISGEIDKRQEIARPTAKGTESNGDGRNRAKAQDDENGRFDYRLNWRNTSNTWVDECTINDTLFCAEEGFATLQGITTPVAHGDYDGLLNIWYLTDLSERETGVSNDANATLSDGHENPWLSTPETADRLGDDARALAYEGWRLWRADIPADKATFLDASDLDLAKEEFVKAIRFEYGRVDEDFTTSEIDWARKNLKDLHDDVDDASLSSEAGGSSIPNGKTGEKDTSHGPSPALIHMAVTGKYRAGEKLSNYAQIDLFRNGGGEKLENHDMDQVEQTAKDAGRPIPLFPMPQTGDASAISVAGTMTVGITAIAAGLVGSRRRLKASIMGLRNRVRSHP